MKVLTVLALLASILAAPAPAPEPVPDLPYLPSPGVATDFTDNFDDLEVSGVGTVLPRTQRVNQYGALFYRDFVYSDDTLSLFFAPPSPKNFIGFSAVGRVFPQLCPTDKFQTFDLKSLYYACIINTFVPVNVPASCTIKFLGRRKDGDTVFEQVDYAAQSFGAKYNKVTFRKEFSGLTQLDISVNNNNPFLVALFDDIEYTAYKQEN
ncbi:hypothetical protein P152DRAFT_445356 [Eremomyces bilateralis CBS 781.70]|uniref:Uncharacterized protein n=1 Tax=Eremomyces bilateralis CBS 781.70 TaxID=1392243 RepID=A0A6G1GH91_9PEZI|nr:uncharacterized protein P152DRAFT_445356 [Eremomyces bilateralis CBS 781.70]KAF1817239.1 hypothetical protein P152DRAFT_445356 [Eremomyces bilateralis CBS 781.70]